MTTNAKIPQAKHPSSTSSDNSRSDHSLSTIMKPVTSGAAAAETLARMNGTACNNMKPGAGGTSYKNKSRNSSSDRTGLSRTVLLRGLLFISLVAAMATCTAVSYHILKASEQEVGRLNYESIALSALNGAKATTKRKVQGSEVMATVMSQTFPEKASWPLVSMDGYMPIAESVAKLTSSLTQSMMVLLDPTQVSLDEFESHTKQVYREQGRPENAGVSDMGFGVWKPDPNKNIEGATCEYNDCRLHDTSAGPPEAWDGSRSIMTPLMMHNQPAANSLLYNLYSQENRGIYIDSMLDCVERAQEEEEEDAVNATTATVTSPHCAVITDILELKVKPGPAGLLFQPIFPANDPLTFVGFATTSIHWEEILADVVPDYVNGLTCVVATDTTTFTYEIRQGIPHLLGEGDLHDEAYSMYSRDVNLIPDGMLNSGALSSASYTLTVYPTAEMFDAFSTNNPFMVSLGFFFVVAFCMLMFVLYDYLMRSEATHRDNILEMKRRFVRFISHEIRTPLNTVCMGLELLEAELAEVLAKEDLDTKSSQEKMASVDFWHTITVDIQENTHTAVEILNDLLNYDKLETGQLKLETSTVRIWDLVERSVHQFQIQAANRKISLDLNVEALIPSTNDQKDIESGGSSTRIPNAAIVLGDYVKLGQVMRNLISNALKFTSEDGEIEVSVCHVPGGLPDATPVLLEGEMKGSRCRTGGIRIAVKDSGAGLTKDQLQQLFAEGVQFDANRLQHGGGSGLGLSIAKGIVEQHHGVIWAESLGQGHGTTFSIELPLYQLTAEEMKIDLALGATASVLDIDRSGRRSSQGESEEKRILVAEDSSSSLKMLVRLLERAGHSCIPVSNGQEAVDAVRADFEELARNPNHNLISTILCDFEMPICNGPEAAKRIREMGYGGIIFGVTGNILEEDVDFFMDNGANEVLPKPISMAQIDEAWKNQKNNAMNCSSRFSGF